MHLVTKHTWRVGDDEAETVELYTTSGEFGRAYGISVHGHKAVLTLHQLIDLRDSCVAAIDMVEAVLFHAAAADR